ncbi:AI-2E family transporter [Roseibaca sp. V10]|uniref:AI-2E family transporter n=1 Tax=Roseinatronobacter domitianus TaxID=2940293 RepID=A0ABT0LX16_9RHOB|nr:AI-2E family transporter [Roseibaca domitiana]MCL1627151.1 AI-2E family transporter [Roseibaca domitiana]
MGIIAFAVVLFLLVQAKFILISLAIAIILFSLTSDAINSIQSMKIGNLRVTNWVASVLAVALIASGLLTMAGLVISQINTVLTTTLAYTEDAQRAIARMFAWMGEDVEASVLATVRSIEVSGYLRSAAGQAGTLLSQVVLIILFVGFLFAERVWFGTKLEKLMSDEAQARRVSAIIGSIIRRVNRYLLVKTLISAVTGGLIFALLSVFNLQFALAMALLTFVLNFIPSVGSIIATLVVTLVAYIQVAEPSTAILIFVIAGMIQFLLGNVIDPMLMGRTLRLSSFGIIISLAFWGAVWGVPGMFLAVPFMVAVMIVCSHIPTARPVAVLLSREGLPEEEFPLPQSADTDTAEDDGYAKAVGAE